MLENDIRYPYIPTCEEHFDDVYDELGLDASEERDDCDKADGNKNITHFDVYRMVAMAINQNDACNFKSACVIENGLNCWLQIVDEIRTTSAICNSMAPMYCASNILLEHIMALDQSGLQRLLLIVQESITDAR